MNKFTQLEKLSELKDKGILTEEEFQIEKEKILGGNNQNEEQGIGALSLQSCTPQLKESYKDSLEYRVAILVKELFLNLGISDSLKYKMTIEDLERILTFMSGDIYHKAFDDQFRKDIIRFSKLIIIGMVTMMKNDRVFNVRDFTANFIKDIRYSRGESEYKDLEKTRDIIHFVFPNHENLDDSEIYNSTAHTNSFINTSTPTHINRPFTLDSYMDGVIWHTTVACFIAGMVVVIGQELNIIPITESAGKIVGIYAVYPLFAYIAYLASILWQKNNKDWFYVLIPVYGFVAPIYTPHKSVKTIIAIVIAGFISFSFYIRILLLIEELLK